ncbi:serine/threonine-protein kinase [Paraliomyxa miuraensis]|uniref:serine/threonine-protein kinase n=1 Tax=Paraliomyxa miuraensis TaxID=376150 RepID=UPI00225C39F5|nr:serine/threonine-protein kinase [Paraliomyxa miuraensis]MCX4246763.1 protein kinase [Paraliomyxa miuraensis]
MSPDDTPRESDPDPSTLRSRRVWKEAGRQDLDFESERLRDRLRAKMFGVEAAPIKIGRFAVEETVGTGGMGVVYAAYDEQLDRRVAVKLLHHSPGEDVSIGEGRMQREAQALAKLSHPNVVQVYDVGTHDGRVFLAMELLTGSTLREWLVQQRRSWREILQCFIEAGQGLAAAHQQGIIHRDFKPANLLFGSDGRIRVVDFGLARSTLERLERPMPALGSAESGLALDVELTQTGEIMGTPAYMSPEQARHELTDARSDQYSYCVALYEALFERRPHVGRSTAEVLIAVAEGEVRSPPRNTKVPARICRAIMRGLSAEPDKRFANMEALLAELAIDDSGRWRMAGGGLVVLAGLGAALWLVDRDPCPSFQGLLAEAWGDEQRNELLSQFKRRGPAAQEMASRTVARLDAYAQDWRKARVEACEAHYVTREQSAELYDRRMACLAERHAELQALVEAFSTAARGDSEGNLGPADEQVIDRAPQAAAELSPIAECSDLERLQKRRQDDPARKELRLRLAQAQAQYKAGRYEQALQAIDEVAREANALDAPEIEAAGLLHRGLLHKRRRVYEPAVEALERAIDLAERGQDDDVAASAWIHLVRGLALLGRHAEAKSGMGHAQAKADRVGDAQLLREAQRSRAVEAWQAGRFDEAIPQQRQFVDWCHEAFGDEHPYTADAEMLLANILGDAERHDEAQAGYARARDVLTRLLGAEHPAVGRVALESGIDHMAARRFEEAKVAFDTAEQIFQAALGPQALELVVVNKALVQLAFARGDLEEADRRARRSVELARLDGLPVAEELEAVSMRAMVSAELGEHEQAIAMCREYLERLTSLSSPSPELEINSLYVRGTLISELSTIGRHDAAEVEATRLLEELGKRPQGEFAGLETHVWLAIGRAHETRGAREDALESFERGLASLARADDAQAPPPVVQAHLRWGWGRLQAPSSPEAIAAVRRAREIFADVEPRPPELAEIDAWLAAAD